MKCRALAPPPPLSLPLPPLLAPLSSQEACARLRAGREAKSCFTDVGSSNISEEGTRNLREIGDFLSRAGLVGTASALALAPTAALAPAIAAAPALGAIAAVVPAVLPATTPAAIPASSFAPTPHHHALATHALEALHRALVLGCGEAHSHWVAQVLRDVAVHVVHDPGGFLHGAHGYEGSCSRLALLDGKNVGVFDCAILAEDRLGLIVREVEREPRPLLRKSGKGGKKLRFAIHRCLQHTE